MASKSSVGQKSVAKGISVKLVKRAGLWCVTYPHNHKNVQEWFSEKPTDEQINSIKEKMNE